jgi:hypothetical protein
VIPGLGTELMLESYGGQEVVEEGDEPPGAPDDEKSTRNDMPTILGGEDAGE